MTRVLLTGVAGFIGMHVARRLLRDGDEVVGVDNLDPYYDVALKEARLGLLEGVGAFKFERGDIADRDFLAAFFASVRPDVVIHLAAQPGVRHSLSHPEKYIDSNLVGFANVLEGCRHAAVRHLVYASSSSVYGANRKVPFAVHDAVDHPVSIYAATKRANELMAESYAHLYRIPTTGLRFFTVYGPWGRPDMAYYKFTRAIMAGDPIDVYNDGLLERDFTYIDDVVEGVVRVARRVPTEAPDRAPHRLYNIGNHSPVKLLDFIETLERAVGRKAQRHMKPMQPGDVPSTYADVADLIADTGFAPATTLEHGLGEFVRWYRSYHG